MKKYLFVFFAFIFLFYFSHSVDAASNFSVASNVTYTIAENGIAHAEFKFQLKNKTSKFYASSYKINVGFENVQNLTAKDENGNLKINVHKSTGGNSVELILDDKIVGKDKIYNFSLQFDTPDIVQNQGNVWELNIPGISNQSEFDDFNVKVSVPKSFGTPSYIKPPRSIQAGASTLEFGKEELQKSGISIAYGEKQTYEFSLTYVLKNHNFFPITQEVALPPSTNYQEVYIENISPKPSQVSTDEDGNWIAVYSLSPREEKNIAVQGIVEISMFPSKSPLSEEDAKKYLQPKDYWESNTKEIQELAKKLKTPKDIYNYIVNTLTYDFSRVSESKPRLGALAVLQNPESAVCLEFTDLFIALARAAGIPAREVDGFAYTQNSLQRPLSKTKDILHAWPEYYDKELQTWVMVDPTWGNTTGGVDYFNVLDFDHFAFVKKGKSSIYPIPAGGYTLSSKSESKNVQVDFTKKSPTAFYDSQLSASLNPEYMAGLPIQGKLIVKNNSNTQLPAQDIYLNSKNLEPKSQKITISAIPPFGYHSVDFSYTSPPFLTKLQDTLTITVGSKKIVYLINVSPFVLSKQTIVIGGIISVIFCSIIFIITIRSRRLRVFRQ